MNASAQISSRSPIRAIERGLEFSFVIAAAWFMLAQGWRRWADPIVDFGREVYVAWRVAGGEWLYRDVASFNGPFSVYFNAGWFTVGGVNLRTLIIANLCVAAAFMLLMRHLLRRCGATWGAGAALLGFALVFLSGHLLFAGNYNWIMPYAHEMTHGLTLSAAALACFLRWVVRGSRVWMTLCGVACGAAFLTKVEIFAALVLALLSGVILCPGIFSRRRLMGLLLMLVAMLAPVGAAVVAFSFAMHPLDAMRGVLGGWRYLGDENLWQMPYFQRIMGLDDPALHARETIISTGWLLAVVGGLAVAARLMDSRRSALLIAGVTLALFIPAALWMLPGQTAWREIGRPLPILMLALAAGSLWSLRTARRSVGASGADAGRSLGRVMIAVWSLALLARLGLHARLYHYGFALAAPAAMVVIAALVDGLPRWTARTRHSAIMVRLAMLAGVGIACLRLAQLSRQEFRQCTIPLAEGADRLYVNDAAAADILAAVAARGPIDSLLVLPEGAMFNYLLRIPNSTPYPSLMPPEVRMFGEDRIIESLRAKPPQMVLMVPRGVGEYGVMGFGFGYAEAIAAFLSQEYVESPAETASARSTILMRHRDAEGAEDNSPGKQTLPLAE